MPMGNFTEKVDNCIIIYFCQQIFEVQGRKARIPVYAGLSGRKSNQVLRLVIWHTLIWKPYTNNSITALAHRVVYVSDE